jgi:hypothetical protein
MRLGFSFTTGLIPLFVRCRGRASPLFDRCSINERVVDRFVALVLLGLSFLVVVHDLLYQVFDDGPFVLLLLGEQEMLLKYMQ